MEFDQSYNDTTPVDWNFPSPTATPTHGSFGRNVFQTPKTSTFPTHFQDAFTTPQIPEYTTPRQPQYSAVTPTQRPNTSSDTLRSNYYANKHAGGSQGAVQKMLRPGQVDQGIAVVSPTYGSIDGTTMHVPDNEHFHSMQMRTPPPTRGTSTRKGQQPQEIAFGTPSTIASRRFMTPQHSQMPMNNVAFTQQTPVQFPQLQFSPEMYQFTNLGPASAPVMPQTRVFWDQSTSLMQPVMQPMLDDPFAPLVSPDMAWLGSSSQPESTQNVVFSTPTMQSFPVQAPTRHIPARRMTDNFGTSTNHEFASVVVDPALLYSAPTRPALRSSSMVDHSKPHSSAAGHKKQDSALQDRAGTMGSSTRLASSLQRSKTIGARSKSVTMSLSQADSLGRSSSANQIPRTASPVKRVGRPSLGSTSMSEGKPRHRRSVILTVDENGMARTEATPADKSPTRSIRERYPALFDSDSSDAESNASESIPSRPSSFIFDKRDERKPKIARLDPPVENLEGLSIPRSSSSASMKKGVAPSRAVLAVGAQLRRQSSLRKATPSRNSRRNPTSGSQTSLIDTCPMDVPADQLQGPVDYSETMISQSHDGGLSWADQSGHFEAPTLNPENALDIHNRRWSMMSFEQQQQGMPILSPPPQQQYHPVFSSPPMPPPQMRPVQIRCQCGYSDDRGQPLVHCHSCTQWAHAGCVGINTQSPPSTFTCFLCTKPSPSKAVLGR